MAGLRFSKSILELAYAAAHSLDLLVELFRVRQDEPDRERELLRLSDANNRNQPAPFATGKSAVWTYLCTASLATGLAGEDTIALCRQCEKSTGTA